MNEVNDERIKDLKDDFKEVKGTMQSILSKVGDIERKVIQVSFEIKDLYEKYSKIISAPQETRKNIEVWLRVFQVLMTIGACILGYFGGKGIGQ
jgi:archaellum component FlaC